jgi:hypothetical protein
MFRSFINYPNIRLVLKYPISHFITLTHPSLNVRTIILGLVLFAKVSNVFSTLFPSHHIKCTESHMFRGVNVGKKITNYRVLMYFATRIF